MLCFLAFAKTWNKFPCVWNNGVRCRIIWVDCYVGKKNLFFCIHWSTAASVLWLGLYKDCNQRGGRKPTFLFLIVRLEKHWTFKPWSYLYLFICKVLYVAPYLMSLCILDIVHFERWNHYRRSISYDIIWSSWRTFLINSDARKLFLIVALITFMVECGLWVHWSSHTPARPWVLRSQIRLTLGSNAKWSKPSTSAGSGSGPPSSIAGRLEEPSTFRRLC